MNICIYEEYCCFERIYKEMIFEFSQRKTHDDFDPFEVLGERTLRTASSKTYERERKSFFFEK